MAHPYVLVGASIISLPFAIPLARFFFHSFDQFVEDARLSTRDDRFVTGLFFVLGGLPCLPFFATLGFCLSVGSILATAYHVLLFLFT